MFSLRMLLAVVAISAVYIAGMVYQTQEWEAAILSLTYVIYAAVMSAALLSKEHRAFFVVFAIFGVAYALTAYFEVVTVTQLALNEMAIRPMLDDNGFLEAVERRRSYGGIRYVDLDPFMAIGHAFFAVMISSVAGVIAEAVVRRSKMKNVSGGTA